MARAYSYTLNPKEKGKNKGFKLFFSRVCDAGEREGIIIRELRESARGLGLGLGLES